MNATSHLPLTRPKLLWLLLAALTLLATILRTLSLFLSMDGIGYFQENATPVIIFYITIAIAAAVCVALFFLINIMEDDKEQTLLAGPRFAGAAFAAATLGATALFLILRASALPTPTALNVLTAVLALCAALYFALRLTRTNPETVVLFGYCAILATTLALILTYFDRYTQMNAPHKLSFHICMLLAMLALVLEQRALLDRAFPRLCMVLTAFCAVFCTATALPNILAFAGGVMLSVVCCDLVIEAIETDVGVVVVILNYIFSKLIVCVVN